MGRGGRILLLLAAAACAREASTADGSSGIVGRVLAGPTCPVQVEASPCPDRPVEALVRVLAASGEGAPVTSFRSREDGTFRVALEPGRYLLVPKVRGTGALTARPVAVTVRPGEFARVDVLLDTGIRGP
jgi:hypothetical protein